jgi:SH3-like domain-containing protein
MNRKLKLQHLLILLLFGLQACTLGNIQTEPAPVTETSGEIPTWTPRPQDIPVHPTDTKPASAIETQTATQAVTDTPPPSPTPKVVTISIEGGNLNIRRGPSTDYNPLYVLRDGETAVVVGRDRISRWILIEVPSVPGERGWVTTETEYTTVKGDVPSLPFVKVEPASPAFIRNCTKNTILILPDYVQLLNKFNEPYNEERFAVGVYQVIDIDVPGTARLDDISLSEGRTVDIIYDGAGEKSKCK